jgi:hypothetical protein
MIEIRLCSIPGARWFDTLVSEPADHLLIVPEGLGASFGKLVEERITQDRTVGYFRSAARGLFLAEMGSAFESAVLVASVAHALAAAAARRDNRKQDPAVAIESFVDGHGTYGDVPQVLRPLGVYSCLTQRDARHLGQWMDGVDPTEFDREVQDMYGDDTIAPYRSVARALQRIFKSADIHDADLCCWSADGSGT